MKINVNAAMQYVYERFALSGEASRMCANVFHYVATHPLPDPAGLILDVLDGFGFDANDYTNMVKAGIIIPKGGDQACTEASTPET